MDPKNPRTNRSAASETQRRRTDNVRRPAPQGGKRPPQKHSKKKKRAKRLNIKHLLVLLVALVIVGGIGWFIYDMMNQTPHMLPTIERIPEYARETAVPQ